MCFQRARSASVAGWFVLALMVACSPEPPEPAAQTSADGIVAEIQSALDAKNFGQAADQAKAAQAVHPANPAVHLLAAQSEAQLGNAGNAATAFGRAMDSGLENAERELQKAAFDQVRSAPAFQPIRDRLRPAVASASSTQQRPVMDRESVRAGDVEIIEDGSGTYVRAGDIVLDTRP